MEKQLSEEEAMELAVSETRAARGERVKHGMTLSEWLEAAGRTDTCSEHDLRAAWAAGEDPKEYRVK